MALKDRKRQLVRDRVKLSQPALIGAKQTRRLGGESDFSLSAAVKKLPPRVSNKTLASKAELLKASKASRRPGLPKILQPITRRLGGESDFSLSAAVKKLPPRVSNKTLASKAELLKASKASRRPGLPKILQPITRRPPESPIPTRSDPGGRTIDNSKQRKRKRQTVRERLSSLTGSESFGLKRN